MPFTVPLMKAAVMHVFYYLLTFGDKKYIKSNRLAVRGFAELIYLRMDFNLEVKCFCGPVTVGISIRY